MWSVCSAHAALFYVVNSLDESLGWVNTETGQYQAQAVPLGTVPNDVVVTDTRLFVVNSSLNTLQIIDRENLSTLNEIELVGTANPWAAAVIDDQRVAVTGLLSGSVAIVNLSTYSVDRTWVTGIGPQAVAVQEDKIYVLNSGVAFPDYGPGFLKRYDTQTYTLVDSVQLGINPQSMEFVQNNLHIICTGNYDDISGSLQIVSLSTMTVDTTIELGGSPGSLSVSGTEGFVAAGGWGSEGHVFRYEIETGAVLNGASNPILTGVGATDIIALPGGGFAVTCFSDASLEVRGSTGNLVSTFPMSAGPGALGVWWGPMEVTEPGRRTANEYELLSAYPNPFNGTVTFSWNSSLQVGSKIRIYDVLGHEAGLITIQPGQRQATWMPENSYGKEVAAGAYFAWLGFGSSYQPVRIIYVK